MPTLTHLGTRRHELIRKLMSAGGIQANWAKVSTRDSHSVPINFFRPDLLEWLDRLFGNSHAEDGCYLLIHREEGSLSAYRLPKEGKRFVASGAPVLHYAGKREHEVLVALGPTPVAISQRMLRHRPKQDEIKPANLPYAFLMSAGQRYIPALLTKQMNEAREKRRWVVQRAIWLEAKRKPLSREDQALVREHRTFFAHEGVEDQ